jgi:hypothetical protein
MLEARSVPSHQLCHLGFLHDGATSAGSSMPSLDHWSSRRESPASPALCGALTRAAGTMPRRTPMPHRAIHHFFTGRHRGQHVSAHLRPRRRHREHPTGSTSLADQTARLLGHLSVPPVTSSSLLSRTSEPLSSPLPQSDSLPCRLALALIPLLPTSPVTWIGWPLLQA